MIHYCYDCFALPLILSFLINWKKFCNFVVFFDNFGLIIVRNIRVCEYLAVGSALPVSD